MQKRIKPYRKAAAFTCSEQESGCVYLIDAADVVATLPAISGLEEGVHYTFVVKTLSTVTGFSVSPAAADSINSGTDDKDLINTAATDAVGDCVTVVADTVDGDTWLTMAQVGTWAAES